MPEFNIGGLGRGLPPRSHGYRASRNNHNLKAHERLNKLARQLAREFSENPSEELLRQKAEEMASKENSPIITGTTLFNRANGLIKRENG